MELKKLSELELIFSEDFGKDDKELKKEIIKDISNFDLIVWYERDHAKIKKDQFGITIDCPTIKTFDYPLNSEKNRISLFFGHKICFKYNNKHYQIPFNQFDK